jgi:hypothetical protein
MQKGHIVFKVSDADIAVMTEKATNTFFDMTVIYMESSFAAWHGCCADCALPVLGGKHMSVFSIWHTVSSFTAIIAKAFRIGMATTFLVFSHLGKVLKSPVIMTCVLTCTTVDLVTVERIFGFMKFVQRFGFFAPWTGFDASREVKLASGHIRSPMLLFIIEAP